MKRVYKRSILFLVVLIGIHLVIVSTGHRYLYTTINNTLLKGRLGPAIDEFSIFENRKVGVGVHQPWNEKMHSEWTLTDDERTAFESLKTVAFLVIQKDSIRFEQYWDGYSSDSRSNSFSMAKSILNIAIGALIQDGKIESLDDPMSKYIPEFDVSAYPDLSIRHLLQMSSGINFDEHYVNPFAYPARANYGTDLMGLTMKYKVTEMPGQRFEYRSGNSQLLSFIIARASGMKLSDYVSERIWKPIGAKNEALWSLDDKAGYEKAFCCFNSNARDFARLGKLYLNRGKWNGKSIVPDWYVNETISKQEMEDVDGSSCKRYGLHWWRHTFEGKEVFYARGILGQYVLVLPEEEIIIVRLGHKRIKPKGVESPPDVDVYLSAALRMLN